MTNTTLAQSYRQKAVNRLKVLDLFLAEGAYSDVIREAQEAVEPPTSTRGRRLFEQSPTRPLQLKSPAA